LRFNLIVLMIRGTKLSADTLIGATGIEQGTKIYCVVRLPEGARTKQSMPRIAVKKREKAKQTN
jgi:hypothetical protein